MEYLRDDHPDTIIQEQSFANGLKTFRRYVAILEKKQALFPSTRRADPTHAVDPTITTQLLGHQRQLLNAALTLPAAAAPKLTELRMMELLPDAFDQRSMGPDFVVHDTLYTLACRDFACQLLRKTERAKDIRVVAPRVCTMDCAWSIPTAATIGANSTVTLLVPFFRSNPGLPLAAVLELLATEIALAYLEPTVV